MTDPTILPTQNTAWGFFGTMAENAEAAWPRAFSAILDATGLEPAWVRAFLDSRHGRHFADDVQGFQTTLYLADAITAAVERWMNWKISMRTSKDTGAHHGAPYLVGFIHLTGIEAARQARIHS